MLLRPRQKEFVERSIAALSEYGNTLGVAPTGAGKTIILSAVIGKLIQQYTRSKVCVLAHRDELTYQNESKFKLVNPTISTSILNSHTKLWNGQVTFAMVQTLSREEHLEQMPKLDLLVIDEAHHVTASSYLDIIEAVRKKNPQVKIFGVTATPMRGDNVSLAKVFNNCADRITISELIESGHLVKPRTWIIDSGDTQEKLQALRTRATGEYNEQEVADILDTEPQNSEVVRHWKEKAGDRQTVVFCSTIAHARNVTNAFNEAGVNTALITGQMTFEQRELVFDELTQSQLQVVVNVSVLTEGWDYPPISCVVLLRSSSYKSTMIQMIGRGLRTIDQGIYPDVIKKDCVVLDFGISSIIHGELEQSISLKVKEQDDVQQLFARETSNTENVSKEKVILSDFTMRELDLLNKSHFAWTNLRKRNGAMIATGFNSWAIVYKEQENWVATGSLKADTDTLAKIIYKGNKLEALAAANDFLSCLEDEESAKKTASWRSLMPTENQIRCLPSKYRKAEINRGDASAIIAYSLKVEPILRQMGAI